MWKVCAQEKVWKEIFQMLTVIFLGNENRIIGESYWLYTFCTCQVFHRDHLYFERGKKPMHEEQFNKRAQTLFFEKVVFAFTSALVYPPAGSLTPSRSRKCHHLQMTDASASTGHSSKLQNCASTWLLDNFL